MTKILVTVDFDGVVSPIDHDRDFSVESGWQIIKLGFDCAIHSSVLEFLQELSENKSADLAWASSWVDSTEDFFIKSNGLIPDFPWTEIPVGKFESIVAKIEDGKYTHAVVMEDSLPVIRKLQNWAKKNLQVELLLIRPKLKIGLTSEHMNSIRKFIEASES